MKTTSSPTTSELMLQIERFHRGANQQLKLCEADLSEAEGAVSRALASRHARWDEARGALLRGDERLAREKIVAVYAVDAERADVLEPRRAALALAALRWRDYLAWVSESLRQADLVYEQIRDASESSKPLVPLKADQIAEIAAVAADQWDASVRAGRTRRALKRLDYDHSESRIEADLRQMRLNVGSEPDPSNVADLANPPSRSESQPQGAITIPAPAEHRVLIVTALPLEAAAVRASLPGGGVRSTDRYGTVRYDGRYASPAGRLWDVRVVATGAKNSKAGALTAVVAAEFSPDYIFFSGVGGSVKDVSAMNAEVKLGDVVVSSMVYPLSGKLKGTVTQIRPHAIPTSHALDQAVMGLEADRALSPGPQRSGEDEPPSTRVPTVFHKPIIATDFVIASRAHRLYKELIRAYPDAYAVDMEAYGFLVATWMLEHRGLVVRGLSDNLENKASNDDVVWQPIAANNAATYCFSLLNELASN